MDNHGTEDSARLRISVRGAVQGVGFRPTVHSLATGMGLSGHVANTGEGVVIEVEGMGAGEFPVRLRESLPPLASITSMDVESIAPLGVAGFDIAPSHGEQGFTLISPDVSICDDCASELGDPSDRRHGYAFINCTNCGPRYTITLKTPYDRPNTTMAPFKMCPSCSAEFEDPTDRRFHAVPNACPECGPRLWLIKDGAGAASDNPIADAAVMMRDGLIVALKGLGGFHLACDAHNTEAVMDLRRRKQRVRKPFALMARDIEEIKKHCHVSPAEEKLLLSARRPVVLLKKLDDCVLPDELAPLNRDLGFMLPYMPMHILLMEEMPLLVMTSGNMGEEPIQHTNDGALSALKPLADAFLLHDREIFMRVDDSVVRSSADGPVFIRRARGYAPEAIALRQGGPEVLAVGADMKNTFTLMKEDRAIVSQHMGDMDKYETVAFFEETLNNLRTVYRAEPVALAHDMHPDYGSTRWALGQDMEKFAVQHHHAHIASVIAEHSLEGNVIGVALDGTGYGPPDKGGNSTLWGGEFLIASLSGFARLGHFAYIRLPGGERAIREPWRIAVALMRDVFGLGAGEGMLEKLGFIEGYGQGAVQDVMKISAMAEFTALSSGAGRMFDAASALLGLCGMSTFEGEAAMALEGAASLSPDTSEHYPFAVIQGQCPAIDLRGVYRQMALDRSDSNKPVPVIARMFHNTMARAVTEAVAGISKVAGIKRVALSGGVFQNVTLLGLVTGMLRQAGMEVYANRLVPSNDGGISLGQAAILRERVR